LELDKGALIKPSIEETPSFQSTRFKGKSGLEAYKDLLINDFLNKPFKEKDIRELATSEGLRIKKKPIKEITSRSIIAQFVENGLLERIDRGLYKSIIKAAPLNLTKLKYYNFSILNLHAPAVYGNRRQGLINRVDGPPGRPSIL
jgi:tRNA(Ile)-lysidine synthase TilS/MesJ